MRDAALALRSRVGLLRPLTLSDRAVGWITTAVVALVAAALRLWGVGFPREKIFDEVYYPTNAAEMLRQGYENNPGRLYVVHPPLGKWFIATGIKFFGDNSYGWRVPAAIAGTIAVIVLTRVVRRLTGSSLLGGIAGLLLAVDGLSVVSSRIALLDIFLQPLVIGGFACLVADRDQLRARLATAVADGWLGGSMPALGPRPWRLAAGVLLGASCAVKWSGIYFLAAFAILSVVWDRTAYRAAGLPRPSVTTATRSLPAALVSLGVVPILTYVASWTGWFLGDNSTFRHWADSRDSRWSWIPGALRSLWHYHAEMLTFHNGLASYHPYRSEPWAWLVDARPVNYYYPQNLSGCGAERCVRQIVALGQPALWWAFLPAVVWCIWLLISRLDWRAGAVLMAFVAGWGSWLVNTERTMFFFYAVPLVPFLVIGVTLLLGDVLGRASAGETRRSVGLAVVCCYVALVIVNFIWLWPILSGQKITFADWQARMWFNNWI